MNFWKRKKDEPRKETDSSLNAVLGSPWLVEYKGKTPFNKAGKYHLFCDRIAEDDREILRGAGFRGVGAAQETHFIHCTVLLNRDAGNPRTLFQFFLCLSEVGDRLDQDLVALEIAKGLKRQLRECRDLGFLIRCKHSREFDWCLDDEDVTAYWLDFAAANYRATVKILSRMRQIEI